MHELSICGSVADIATRHAGGRQVDVIHLRIGQLRQIVPDTLAYCWSMVATSAELDGSRLDREARASTSDFAADMAAQAGGNRGARPPSCALVKCTSKC